MFTGIIEAVGQIRTIERRGGDMRFTIATGKLDLSDVKLGDSIAANGVCLTAIALPGGAYVADVSNETLTHTTLGALSVGSRVNLEKALTPMTRLGGHIVSGHVDGVGIVEQIAVDGRSTRYGVSAPETLAKYIAGKGSITIDGISLTVNAVKGVLFELNIVPHTAQETTVSQWQVGSRVNLEVDLLARYLERLLLGKAPLGGVSGDIQQGEAAALQPQGITESFLAEHGFLHKR